MATSSNRAGCEYGTSYGRCRVPACQVPDEPYSRRQILAEQAVKCLAGTIVPYEQRDVSWVELDELLRKRQWMVINLILPA
jgi:hypothetical protein